jgi:hypothetical protein
LATLARHRGDELKIVVIVEQREPRLLSGGRDQKIGDLPASLATRRQEALYLAGAPHMVSGCLDECEDRQVRHVLVPFVSVAAPVTNLQVGDASPAKAAGVSQRVDDRAHRLQSESANDARIQ